MSLLFFALLAWQTPIDEGTLVVHTDTAVLARETYRLTGVRIGALNATLTEFGFAAPRLGARYLPVESMYEYGSRAGIWRMHANRSRRSSTRVSRGRNRRRVPLRRPVAACS